jgi:hypothetical protein
MCQENKRLLDCGLHYFGNADGQQIIEDMN